MFLQPPSNQSLLIPNHLLAQQLSELTKLYVLEYSTRCHPTVIEMIVEAAAVIGQDRQAESVVMVVVETSVETEEVPAAEALTYLVSYLHLFHDKCQSQSRWLQ